MVFSIHKPTNKKQNLVNTQEVYTLWDLLVSKYTSLDQLNIYFNYTHDVELKALLQSYISENKRDVIELESYIAKHAIMAPRPPRKEVFTSADTEVIQDELIGNWLLLMYQGLIEMKLRAVRTSVTNDHIRDLFIKYTKKATNTLDSLIKYLKAKGWINQPPMYPNIPLTAKEKIDTSEAFHLWDLLTFRYDNIEQTQLYSTLAHDGDFKMIMKKGLQDVLKKQAKLLEKELKHFAIPFPTQAKSIYTNIPNTELVDDPYLYKVLVMGMQTATVVHAQAVKQSTTNDRIRKIFIKLLMEEISAASNMIKFGKLKGWANSPPSYTSNKG